MVRFEDLARRSGHGDPWRPRTTTCGHSRPMARARCRMTGLRPAAICESATRGGRTFMNLYLPNDLPLGESSFESALPRAMSRPRGHGQGYRTIAASEPCADIDMRAVDAGLRVVSLAPICCPPTRLLDDARSSPRRTATRGRATLTVRSSLGSGATPPSTTQQRFPDAFRPADGEGERH
jgi:hypothetical protein